MSIETFNVSMINALGTFVSQKPRLSFADYGDIKAYNRDARKIRKYKKDVETFIDFIYPVPSIEEWNEAFRAFSGRLSYTVKDDSIDIDYCTGQYWCTEYRYSVACVLASLIWNRVRNEYKETDTEGLRRHLRSIFGNSIQKEYFN